MVEIIMLGLVIFYIAGVIISANRYKNEWGEVCCRCGTYSSVEAFMWPIRNLCSMEWERCPICDRVEESFFNNASASDQ